MSGNENDKEDAMDLINQLASLNETKQVLKAGENFIHPLNGWLANRPLSGDDFNEGREIVNDLWKIYYRFKNLAFRVDNVIESIEKNYSPHVILQDVISKQTNIVTNEVTESVSNEPQEIPTQPPQTASIETSTESAQEQTLHDPINNDPQKEFPNLSAKMINFLDADKSDLKPADNDITEEIQPEPIEENTSAPPKLKKIVDETPYSKYLKQQSDS